MKRSLLLPLILASLLPAFSEVPAPVPMPVTTERDIPISRIKEATASTQRMASTAAANAVDGSLENGWGSELGVLKTKGPQWITLELDEPQTLDAVRYFLASKPEPDPKREYVNWIGRIQKFEISVSNDGNSFQTIASGTWNKTDLNEQRVSFPPVQARFVRLTAFNAERDMAGATEISLESPNPPPPKGKSLAPVADADARRAAFASRDSDQNMEKLAGQLAKILRRDNPQLSEFFAAEDKGNHADALKAFQQAVFKRLVQYEALLEPEPPATVPLGVPQEMMANIISAPALKTKFDVGEPGAIPWDAPEIIKETKAKLQVGLDETTFNPLLAAYMHSGNKAYLQKWAAYIDDLLLNDPVRPNISSFNMRDHDSKGTQKIQNFLKQLFAAEEAHPGSLELLPPGLLARYFTRCVPDYLALWSAYYHANAQNWTHHTAAGSLNIAAFLDGLLVLDVPLVERCLRLLETYETRSNLPDGTEAEQAMWYNWGWGDEVINALNRLDAIAKIDPERGFLDPQRRTELEESILRRNRFSSQIYTQRSEWPLFLRGDDRKLWGLGNLTKEEPLQRSNLQPFWGPYRSRLVSDPAIAPVLGAIGPEKQPGIKPSYTSNFFPWSGYRIIRENWDPKGQYGTMFCSPQPGKYGARGGSDHLNFGLSAFGQDLLVDSPSGHYGSFPSPLTVDGKNQNFRAGYPQWGHKQWLLNGWEKPANSRFHSSPELEFMEGTYSGPYGGDGLTFSDLSKALDNAIKDVSHTRQVIYVRQAGLWIVTDRLQAGSEHEYSWRWLLPCISPEMKSFGFLPTEIQFDEKSQTVRTSKPQGPNITMRSFAAVPLKTKRRDSIAKDKPLKSVSEIQIAPTQKQKDLLIVTAILPRPDEKADFVSLEPLADADGFSATLADGTRVVYQVARNASGNLNADGTTATGEALLVVEKEGKRTGLALDATELQGQSQNFKDLTFAADGESMRVAPIWRPIESVQIEPATNVFISEQTVSLKCDTADVEIRYTLDGSEPTRQSTLYEKPFNITSTSTVKARAFRPGYNEAPDELKFTTASPVSLGRFVQEKPLPAIDQVANAPGLKATCYEGDWKKLFLNTGWEEPTRSGVVPDLMDISLRQNHGPFTMIYEGIINVPETGVYTFHAPFEFMDNKIDNGYDLLLEIDGRKWIPSTRRHAFGNWSVALEKGAHSIRLKYLDYRGDKVNLELGDEVLPIAIDYTRKGAAPRNIEGMKGDWVWGGGVPELLVSGPEMPKQPIPSAWLAH